MLKVTVDIHPMGSAEDAYTIHSLYIANRGRVGEDNPLTQYVYWLDRDPRIEGNELGNGKVLHVRDNGAYNLIQLILEDMELELEGVDDEHLTDEGG